MFTAWWRRLALLLAVGVSACSSTTLPPGGGGGTGGVGGTGGGGGRVDGGSDAGGASGAGGAVPLPGCLQELQAACPIAASCAAPSVDAGGFVRVCTSGGGNQCAGDAGSPTQQQVYKADGSLCYTLTTDSSRDACEYSTYTWTDANGIVAARGSLSYTNVTLGLPVVLTIACASDAGSNDSLSCDPRSPGCSNPAARVNSACPCAAP